MPPRYTKVLPHRKTTPTPSLPIIQQPLPALKYLFGCYFHPDWDLEYATSQEAIKDYLENNPKEKFVRAVKEIDWLREWLRQTSLSEDDISTVLLEQLHLSHIPISREAISYDSWLAIICEQVTAGIRKGVKEAR